MFLQKVSIATYSRGKWFVTIFLSSVFQVFFAAIHCLTHPRHFYLYYLYERAYSFFSQNLLLVFVICLTESFTEIKTLDPVFLLILRKK